MSDSDARVPSRTALIASRVGQASAVGALLGVWGARLGLLSPMGGFSLFAAGAVLGGLVSLLLGLVGLGLTRGGDASGRRQAWIGASAGAALLAVVAVVSAPSGGLPRINDITTNLDDPPVFGAALREPANAGRDMGFPPEFAAQIRAAYADLAPVALPADPARAFEFALEAARSLGWEITWTDPQVGAFEAREVSALFRFVDDIRVRVRAEGEGSIVDVRSKSRDGQGDLGANAARIRAFASALSHFR